MKNRKTFLLLLCAVLAGQSTVASASVPDYQEAVEECKKKNKPVFQFEIEDGSGNKVIAAAREDVLYLTVKDDYIRSAPGEKGRELSHIYLGTELQRMAVCNNGWSKVSCETEEGKVIGYVADQSLSDTTGMEVFTDTVTVEKDSDILDFPGRKDGEVVGEVLELDEVTRTGTVNQVWSRIEFEDDSGAEQIGYIPTSSLEGQEETPEVTEVPADENGVEAGILHEGNGTGVFAEAVDEISDIDGTVTESNGVQVGSPIAVSSDATLIPLGTFRITHYCQCSICCGPWANGITSTGVTATTNRTIAVDPSQIPYGSRVVINGQVYVAEDCGGAIKQNCIDIYVASHAEGEAKGVYYTDVYLLQ